MNLLTYSNSNIYELYDYIINIDDVNILNNIIINDLYHKAKNNEFNMINDYILKINNMIDIDNIERKNILLFIKGLYNYFNYNYDDNDILKNTINNSHTIIVPNSIVTLLRIYRNDYNYAIEYMKKLCSDNNLIEEFLYEGIVIIKGGF